MPGRGPWALWLSRSRGQDGHCAVGLPVGPSESPCSAIYEVGLEGYRGPPPTECPTPLLSQCWWVVQLVLLLTTCFWTQGIDSSITWALLPGLHPTATELESLEVGLRRLGFPSLPDDWTHSSLRSFLFELFLGS